MIPESFHLPLDKELQERLHWLTRLRWAAGLAILAAIAVGPKILGIPLPRLPLLGVAFTLLAYNLVLHLNLRWIASTPVSARNAVYLQIGLDWAALSATVYLTGGIVSPVILAYAFHLIIGAILLSRRVCYLLTCAASALLGILAWMTPVDGPREPFRIWVEFTIFFFVTTWLANSIAARLREKEDALSLSRQALDRSYQELESLHKIGQLVNSTLDLKEVLGLIAEHTTRLFGVRGCFVRTFDKSGKTLSIGGSHGLSRAYIDKGPVEVEKSWVDFEVLKGRTIQVPDVTEDLRFQYREEARREGLRSMLSCPMRAKDRTLGVIRIYTAEPHVFGEQEERLLQNLANLGALALQNARSFGDLQALEKERIWFARMTHHQLRSPLAAAQGAIDALPYAGPLNDKQVDLVARASRRIQDSFDTIRDLLDSAAAQRFHEGEPETARPVRPAETLRRVLDTAREQARAKDLAFVEEPGGEDCIVRADPGDLEKIFSNLLTNAVNYTASGRIAFGMRPAEDGWVEAWVEDTGIGIDKDELERIFEGFYRTPAAKATGAVGTGLGLSIVSRLAQRLGGAVSVESEVGKGSRFTVRLPVASD
ncbi:MAG: GAF domain-containing sensor histidine kinase [Deltaproteobacteria bacterium]|nr:GAF domain-containing sensor histidine kinase [Deltaproteobacteria bacterium]